MDSSLKREMERCLQGRLLFDEPLSKHTTFRIGGKAHVWFEPEDGSDLRSVLILCQIKGVPYYLFGNASNLIVKDQGFPGVIISLESKAFKSIFLNETEVICGGGVRIPEWIHFMKEHALTGGEFLTGIPGTIGGALRMNAGAHGGEISDILVNVTLMNSKGQIEEKKKEELSFSYREAPYFIDKIIVSASFHLEKGNAYQIQESVTQKAKRRQEVTPPYPNAGCIFKNPEEGISAGKLIEEAGLKGYQRGRAQVSFEHANYFVNLGDARAEDLLSLIEEVKRQVRDIHGVELETEVKVIGNG